MLKLQRIRSFNGGDVLPDARVGCKVEAALDPNQHDKGMDVLLQPTKRYKYAYGCGARCPYFPNTLTMGCYGSKKEMKSASRKRKMVFLPWEALADGTAFFCAQVDSESLLMFPSSVFLSKIKSTINKVRLEQEHVALFSNEVRDSDDIRMSNAIIDCGVLLDNTMDHLRSSRSLMLNPNGEYFGTGNQNADLKTWLIAAITNQETCIEGFEGATHFAKDRFVKRIRHITSQLSTLLGMVHEYPLIGSNENGQKGNHSRHIPTSSDHVVVAKDGSGNFTSIMDAILSAPNKSKKRYVIYVKEGVYFENVEITKNKWNLMLVGDGPDLTVITGNQSVGGSGNKVSTYRSATFSVSGRRFIAKGITFENTAGPSSGQAVAVRSDSDLSVFYKCRILGFQDTLYVHTGRQFYKECDISGTIDFIFGKGAAVFQKCLILVRNGHENSCNTITAHSCRDRKNSTGFSIQLSIIKAADNDIASVNSTYLGRPWREYATTVFMQCYMSEIIRPEGWAPWGKTLLDKLYYGEYNNYGPGAVLDGRVKWSGYHIMNSEEAKRFTVAKLLHGDLWLPSTGIGYTSGLPVV